MSPFDWSARSLWTARLMAIETERFGRELDDGAATNAVTAELLRAGLVLPRRAARRRGRNTRRATALVDAFLRAVVALAELADEPVRSGRPPRRAALPWWAGSVAACLLVAVDLLLARLAAPGVVEALVVGGAVAVVTVPAAILAGRYFAISDGDPDARPAGMRVTTALAVLLLVGASVAAAGLGATAPVGWWAPAVGAVFGLLPAAVAAVEAAGANPGDRADRLAARAHRRADRAFRRQRRRWARALARWIAAHARLGAALDAVTGPALAARVRSEAAVHTAAARLGWRRTGHQGGLPDRLSLPVPGMPADELQVPLRLHAALAPDLELARTAVGWLSRDRLAGAAPAARSTHAEDPR